MDNQIFIIFLFVLIGYYFFNSCQETFRNYTAYGSDKLDDGYYVIRGSRNKLYCSDDANGVLCNKDLAGPHETFYVQNLGRGQFSIRSVRRNLYCSQTATGMRCTAPTVGDWEVFNISHLGKGRYAIQSNRNKQYCSASGQGLVCDVPNMYGWQFQMFEFIKVPHENIK